MTYFDIVEYINSLKEKPRNNGNLSVLTSNKINLSGNIERRLIDHINSLIVYRLNIIDQQLVDFILGNGNIDEFSLRLVELKNEIEYLKKFALPYFSNDGKNTVLSKINNNVNIIYDDLLSCAERSLNKDQLLIIIKNNKEV